MKKEFKEVRSVAAGNRYQFFFQGNLFYEGVIEKVFVSRRGEEGLEHETYLKGDGYVELPIEYFNSYKHPIASIGFRIFNCPITIHYNKDVTIKKEVENRPEANDIIKGLNEIADALDRILEGMKNEKI